KLAFELSAPDEEDLDVALRLREMGRRLDEYVDALFGLDVAHIEHERAVVRDAHAAARLGPFAQGEALAVDAVVLDDEPIAAHAELDDALAERRAHGDDARGGAQAPTDLRPQKRAVRQLVYVAAEHRGDERAVRPPGERGRGHDVGIRPRGEDGAVVELAKDA